MPDRARQCWASTGVSEGARLHIHLPSGCDAQGWAVGGHRDCDRVVSALTGMPVRGDVAMTGEITLRGRVLPIGGLKEKPSRRTATGSGT